jgi:hypothetical protein
MTRSLLALADRLAGLGVTRGVPTAEHGHRRGRFRHTTATHADLPRATRADTSLCRNHATHQPEPLH